MFKEIFITEFKYWFKKPSTYIYFFAFSGFALLVFLGSAGFFDSPTSKTNPDDFLNSPYWINYMAQYFNKFFLFLLPAVVGATIYKDYKYKVHSILYTFPILKRDYILGKFLSAFTIVLIICTSFYLAVFIGEFFPNLRANKIGETNILGHLQAYFVYTLPNMLIWGAVVFAIVLTFRNVYSAFGVIILLFFIQIITENAFSENKFLVALFDPFGQNTVSYITQDWTSQQFNTELIPIKGAVLYNRLLLLGVSGVIFMLSYVKFSFSENAISLAFRSRKSNKIIGLKTNTTTEIELPKVAYDYSFKQQLIGSWKTSNMYTKYIVKNWMFLGIVALAILTIVFMLSKFTSSDNMAILPTTTLVLRIPLFFYTKIIILLTFIYTGMLVQRERNAEVYQLTDTAPISNWSIMLSKLMAILKMQGILLLVMIISGIGLQIAHGYYQFEIGTYIYHLFVITWIPLIIWAVASILLHTVLQKPYISIFLLFMTWIGIGILPEVGIDSKVILFNAPDSVFVNEINSYGSSLKSFFLVESYWGAFSIILLIATFLLWLRGTDQTFKQRISEAKKRFLIPIKITTLIAIIGFVFLGFKVYQEENKILISDEKEMNSKFDAFSENSKKYQYAFQPKIVSLNLNLDIYPEENNFKAAGYYYLVNKNEFPVDTLLIKTGFDENTSFELNRPFTLVEKDEFVKFTVLKLVPKLQPGDSILFSFEIENIPNSTFETNSNVLNNGTFLKSDFLPKFGYFLKSKNQNPEDSLARMEHYQAIDSDLIDLDVTISTSSDQKAIGPGYLTKEWEENGRHFYAYKMNRKIKNVLGFHSGKFETRKEEYKGVNFEINHHKLHDKNLENMMDGMKAALDYNTKYFSPYQHSEARIIEFPQSEGTYATTAANNISTSEIRFIANSDTAGGKIDLSFYVPSHELTHQWWGNQLIPAGTLGSLMLTESITEYISLQIYEDKYGKENANEFLKMQVQRYLRRKKNSDPALMYVRPDQDNIAYGKGAIAFHALSYYWGENEVNKVLQNFLLDYQFQEAPYPTSIELIDRFKEAIPDSLAYIITDYFETVTFYDNKIIDVNSVKNSNNNYSFNIDIESSKYQLDKKGNRMYPNEEKFGEVRTMPLSDYLEIGWYDDQDKLIGSQIIKVTEGVFSLVISENQLPVYFKIDPNCLTIDEDYGDNRFYVD